ncbi:HBL349Cp [Eremothecium sinecaudum]|uniref:HBL349Cp n=1 Tax=Eremothecium sinecaudum TaxID=45286 RepID=A0A109UVY8_9SACH|nr:HBL349Cp [Eremothecium sinecaudum]AMD18553.1 HBL349Cp [Eremothecium sinecaudum]
MSLGRKAAERLADKTVLIVGASSGIGKATATEYCDTTGGQIKLILAARRFKKLQEIKKDIEKDFQNVKIHIVELDVSDSKKIASFVEELPEDFKDIDILVNCAGLALGLDDVGDIDPEDVETMINTNFIGLVHITQAVIPIFKAKNSGDVVNVSSISAIDSYPKGSIYCASKHAVRGFTKALRQEMNRSNIRVIEIAPGLVETEFFTVRFRGDEEKAKKIFEVAPALHPDDVADSIVYATSRKPGTTVADLLILPTQTIPLAEVYREKKINV